MHHLINTNSLPCPKVVVIVATKMEELNIGNCLLSIKKQLYENVAVIVIDAFSTDSTVKLAKAFTKEVYSAEGGLARQRNYGISKMGDAKYLVFIDADMILPPGLIGACVAQMENNDKISGLFIDEIILGKSYLSRVRRFERSFYSGTAVDAGRFYRATDVLKVGGFDENPLVTNSVEDWDFDHKIRKLGDICLLNVGKLECDEKEWEQRSFVLSKGGSGSDFVIYHNESEFSLVKYLHKKSFYASNFDLYINKWGANDYYVNRQFSFIYRYFTIFLENEKWKKFFLGFFFVPGLYFLRIFVGLVYLLRNTLHANSRPKR